MKFFLAPGYGHVRTCICISYVHITFLNTIIGPTFQVQPQAMQYLIMINQPNPGPHPPQRRRPTNNENATSNGTTSTTADNAGGHGEMNTPGHGYEYITVQK